MGFLYEALVKQFDADPEYLNTSTYVSRLLRCSLPSSSGMCCHFLTQWEQSQGRNQVLLSLRDIWNVK